MTLPPLMEDPLIVTFVESLLISKRKLSTIALTANSMFALPVKTKFIWLIINLVFTVRMVTECAGPTNTEKMRQCTVKFQAPELMYQMVFTSVLFVIMLTVEQAR